MEFSSSDIPNLFVVIIIFSKTSVPRWGASGGVQNSSPAALFFTSLQTAWRAAEKYFSSSPDSCQIATWWEKGREEEEERERPISQFAAIFFFLAISRRDGRRKYFIGRIFFTKSNSGQSKGFSKAAAGLMSAAIYLISAFDPPMIFYAIKLNLAVFNFDAFTTAPPYFWPQITTC